jgi:DNA repair exonuclease SbcCD nuclease subunit
LKIVATSDLHFRSSDSWGVNTPNGNSRLLDKIKTLKSIVQKAIDIEASAFYIGGDIFDRLNPSEKLRSQFVECISPLMVKGIPLILLRGNHDTNFDVTNFGAESALANSLKPDCIWFITEPTSIEFGSANLLFVPYGFDIPVDSGCSVLFGHCGVEGAETGVGVIKRDNEDAPLSAFKTFKNVYLGHYHKPQELNFKDTRIVYIGSSNRWDMGERYDEKRYLIISIEDNGVTHESIPIEDRKFVQLEFHEGESWECSEDITCACVKVVFKGTKSWIKSLNLDSIRRSYEKLGPTKIDVVPDFIDSKKSSNVDINPLSSPNEIIAKYCQDKKISKEMLELGLKIFKEANNT